MAGGFKHVLCFLRHDPLTVLHVSRKFLVQRFLRSQLGVRSLRDDFQTPEEVGKIPMVISNVRFDGQLMISSKFIIV